MKASCMILVSLLLVGASLTRGSTTPRQVHAALVYSTLVSEVARARAASALASAPAAASLLHLGL